MSITEQIEKIENANILREFAWWCLSRVEFLMPVESVLAVSAVNKRSVSVGEFNAAKLAAQKSAETAAVAFCSTTYGKATHDASLAALMLFNSDPKTMAHGVANAAAEAMGNAHSSMVGRTRSEEQNIQLAWLTKRIKRQ